MIQRLFHPLTAAQTLLESDSVYFELAAQRRVLSTFEVAYVPDLIELPVSCVAHRIMESLVRCHVGEFVNELEETCHELGSPLARLYLQENAPEIERTLLEQGYRRKVEIGFLTKPKEHYDAGEDVRLSRVITEQDWREKLEIHQQEDVGSDGYRSQGWAWTELMRRKCSTVTKIAFLIRYQDQPVGTVSIVELPYLRRLKNLFVLPKYRGLGIAASAVKLLLMDAARDSVTTMGVFGIEGSAGVAVYQSCGFREATRQYEYTKLKTQKETDSRRIQRPR